MPEKSDEVEKPQNENEMATNYKQRYGWGRFRPQCLNFLNNHFAFACCSFVLAFIQCMVIVGVWTTNLTTIEKRYGLSSTQLGSLGSIYDTSYAVLGVFVSYFWTRNKPKKIACGTLILVGGVFIMTIPQYIIGKYKGGIYRDEDWCIPSNNTDAVLSRCNYEEGSPWYYFFIFCVGAIVAGLGATPIWTLGPAHIYDVSPASRSGVYMSLMFGGCAVGPSLGFILGERILRVYVDIQQPEGSNLHPEDHGFIGAWWIGYLASALLLLPPICVMSGFPKEFPNSKEIREENLLVQDNVASETFSQSDVKNIIPSTKLLLKNHSYTCINLMNGAIGLSYAGFGLFLPKYLESQFHISPSNSAIYTGYITIPSAVIGSILGGLVVKLWGKSAKQLFKILIGLFVVEVALTMVLLIGCDSRQIVGVHTNYIGTAGVPDLDSGCRGACSCAFASYKPLCTVKDRLTYYSPCHAGCAQNNSVGDYFYNCTCFPPGVYEARTDRCLPECNSLTWFAIGTCIFMMVGAATVVPGMELTFRIVPDNLGSYAMGLQQLALRMLGFVPAPLLYGGMIDKACILWGKDTCTGKTTSCHEYDNKDFKLYILLLSLVLNILALIFITCGRILYRPPPTRKGTGPNVNAPLNERDESKTTVF